MRESGTMVREGKRCISLVVCFSNALFIIILLFTAPDENMVSVWSRDLWRTVLFFHSLQFWKYVWRTLYKSYVPIILCVRRLFTSQITLKRVHISSTKGVLAQKSLLHLNALFSLFAPAFFLCWTRCDMKTTKRRKSSCKKEERKKTRWCVCLTR